MDLKHKLLKERPRFENKELQEFEERMKNMKWDNEEGEGSLSEESIEIIAEAFVQDMQNQDENKDDRK